MSSGSPYAGQEEDHFDRYFNRPLARPVARALASLGWHPNAVSCAGLAAGVAAGWFWQYPAFHPAVYGVALLVVATILDNADGMVARLTGKSSEFGRVLDGVCDNFVFASIYSFSLIAIWNLESPLGARYGVFAIPLVLAGAASHSFQSAMTDFYKMEWKYWVLRSDGARFRPAGDALEEARARGGLHGLFLRLLAGHARQQAGLAGVRLREAGLWRVHRDRPDFPALYARLNRGPMQGWFLLGPNWHLYGAMAFALAGRMDLYFLGLAIVLNGVLAATMAGQARSDRALSASLANR